MNEELNEVITSACSWCFVYGALFGSIAGYVVAKVLG